MLNDDGPKYDLELSKKDEARHGLWSLVAQKAKVMLDENGTPRAHVRTLKPKGKGEKSYQARSRDPLVSSHAACSLQSSVSPLFPLRGFPWEFAVL